MKFEGNEILSIDDFDIFACYRDLWKTKSEKRNAIRQDIISSVSCTNNCIKLRINAADKASNAQDNAIADTYGNKFIIPVDFEMLDSSAPYYITKQDSETDYVMKLHSMINNGVSKSAVASPDAKYEISIISLEYEIVIQPTLARSIKTEYDEMVLLYDRIIGHRQIPVNKSDTTWHWSYNMPCKSLKGILELFEEEKSYERDTSKFYNPKIQKSLCHCGR